MKKVNAYRCEICGELYYTKAKARACNAKFEFKESEYRVGMLFRVEDGSGGFLGIAGLIGVKKVGGHYGSLAFYMVGSCTGKIVYPMVEARKGFDDEKVFEALDVSDMKRDEFVECYNEMIVMGFRVSMVVNKKVVYINEGNF